MRAYPRNEEIRSSGWSGTESPYECNCDFPDVAHVLGCPLRQLSVDAGPKDSSVQVYTPGRKGVYTKPMEAKPRTCCETHRDTCQFGRQHRWSIGWFGGPKSGLGFGTEGWHDSMICTTCMGVCIADLEEGQVA